MDSQPVHKPRRSLKGITPKKKERRGYHITVRLSEDERRELDDRSARAGLMAGSYVRQAVFGSPMPRQVRRPVAERAELARLLAELGKVGGNINQLAHHANAGQAVIRHDLLIALGDLQVMRDALLMALGREP